MFRFPKPDPAPEGPVAFDISIEIDRPAAEVYRLLDWADPRNAKRELGHRVEALDDAGSAYHLTLREMPDHLFDIRLIEAVPGERYAFWTEIVPRVGRLERNSEHYAIEPIGGHACKLRLTVEATFKSGLSMKKFEQELAMMSHACHRSVLKLKIHAELGPEAVREFDEQNGF
jgi:hypothetical protein